MNGSGGVGEKINPLERAAGKEGPWGQDRGVRVQLEPEGEDVQLRRQGTAEAMVGGFGGDVESSGARA